jgi:hypothetical protein
VCTLPISFMSVNSTNHNTILVNTILRKRCCYIYIFIATYNCSNIYIINLDGFVVYVML